MAVKKCHGNLVLFSCSLEQMAVVDQSFFLSFMQCARVDVLVKIARWSASARTTLAVTLRVGGAPVLLVGLGTNAGKVSYWSTEAIAAELNRRRRICGKTKYKKLSSFIWLCCSLWCGTLGGRLFTNLRLQKRRRKLWRCDRPVQLRSWFHWNALPSEYVIIGFFFKVTIL